MPTSTPVVTRADITDILRHWNLELKQVLDDVEMAGSPERCKFRIVVETGHHGRVVLERIATRDLPQKKMIATTLKFLDRQQVGGVFPYLPSESGSFIVTDSMGSWQVAPYISGVRLNRPDYAFESRRSISLAEFLINFWKRTKPAPDPVPLTVFSITSYITDMAGMIARHRPGILNRLEPVMDWLGMEFMEVHDRLPTRFCHGDFHPMNIIWSETGINAVIDWEFCGIKPEIYDVANLVGCLGMENPESLSGPLVCDLIDQLMSSEILSPESWKYLPEFMTALRFAWMAEWLRNDDGEMIELETVYMKLLMDNSGDMKDVWHLCSS